MDAIDPFVHVRGASENNLRNIDVDLPRNAMVAFTGVSGSGKSSLAFGTLYAEAQRRYFESVAPYVRRLLQQVGAPHVQEITGLPPAVALQQRRGAPSSRSTVGTITTLSNLLRMLYSRAGTYPPRAARLEAESFSPNTPAGACPECHGLGVVHDVAEELLVPDPSLSIREGAIAAWPGAWQGANLRSVVSGLGIDIDRPWRRLRKKDRDWLLYTDEQPSVYIEPEEDRIDYGYQGTFWSARKHVMHVLADSKSEKMRERALRFVRSVPCPECHGSGLRPEALAVTFAGRSIAEVNAMPLNEVAALLRPVARRPEADATTSTARSGETTEVAVRICGDLVARVDVLLDLGLGIQPRRRSTTLSPGRGGATPTERHAIALVAVRPSAARRTGEGPSADLSHEHGTALLSLPSLGAGGCRERHGGSWRKPCSAWPLRGPPDVSKPPIADRRSAPSPAASRPSARGPVDEEELADLRYVADGPRGYVKLLVGMVRANRPWRLVPGLSKALAAALATGAIATVDDTVWSLATSLGTPRLVVATVGSVGLMIGWLIVDANLWHRTTEGSPEARQRSVLYNTSTLVTVSIGAAVCYVGLMVVSFVWALFVLNGHVFASATRHPLNAQNYCTLSWFVASIATVGGALGSGLESDEAIRAAAYSTREQERRHMLQGEHDG
ncbi:UvrABC system protein A [Streptomyces microflavus]